MWGRRGHSSPSLRQGSDSFLQANSRLFTSTCYKSFKLMAKGWFLPLPLNHWLGRPDTSRRKTFSLEEENLSDPSQREGDELETRVLGDSENETCKDIGSQLHPAVHVSLFQYHPSPISSPDSHPKGRTVYRLERERSVTPGRPKMGRRSSSFPVALTNLSDANLRNIVGPYFLGLLSVVWKILGVGLKV